jgi:purine nucleosidase
MPRIILDTDIGDDTDDVLALAFALASPEIELIGITTVLGHVLERARIARYMLDLFGQPDIPVHAGLSVPLAGSIPAAEVPPPQYLPRMAQSEPQSHDAIGFMAQALRRQRLTLVGIAPLTNIATLLLRHPDLTTQIDEIVLMGGAYYRHANEYNFVCDPEAAQIVFGAGVPVRVLGLDITSRTGLSREFLLGLDRTDPRTGFLFEMCEIWFAQHGYTPVLHDPLAVHAACGGGALTFQPETIRIETRGKHTRGFSYCEEHRLWGREPPEPNALVAADVDVEAFTRLFKARTFGA